MKRKVLCGLFVASVLSMVNADELKLPSGCEAVEGALPEPHTGTGFAKEIVHKRTGIPLVFIPSGKFTMGSTRLKNEQPVHEVTIEKAFYLAKQEITNEQFLKFRVAGGASGWDCFGMPTGAAYPAACVSWCDASDFCEWSGLRLPTEAEWEYACRAGSQASFCYGDDEQKLGEFSWCSLSSTGSTHPVGMKKPNGWGLYDMHGNVWEWVEDVYHSDYKGAPNNGEAYIEGKNQRYRVLRGGSWSYDPEECRSAYRRWDYSTYGTVSYGFRPCLDIVPIENSIPKEAR